MGAMNDSLFDISSLGSSSQIPEENGRLAENDSLKFLAFRFELLNEISRVLQPLLYRQDTSLRITNLKAGIFYLGFRR